MIVQIPLLREHPLVTLLCYVFWQQVLLVLLHLKMSRFPLSSWRILSLALWSMLTVLLSVSEKCCATYNCPPQFLLKNLLSLELSSLVANEKISLTVSTFFVYNFQKFNSDLFCIDFFGLICLRLAHFLESSYVLYQI